MLICLQIPVSMTAFVTCEYLMEVLEAINK